MALAQILPDAYSNDFSVVALPFPDVGWNAQWPFEHGVVAYQQFLEFHGYESDRSQIDRVILGLSMFENKASAMAKLGYLKGRGNQMGLDVYDHFELVKSYVTTEQSGCAKSAMMDLIYRDEGMICDLDRFVSRLQSDDDLQAIFRTAEAVYEQINPWIDAETDTSGPILDWEPYGWIEVVGKCPFCGTEIYIESDIPILNIRASSAHMSQRCDGLEISCPSCDQFLDFTICNSYYHSYFSLEPLPSGLQKWAFRYRKRCSARYWHP